MGFPDPNACLAALAVVGALSLAGCSGSNDGGDGEPTLVAGQYSYLDEFFAQVNLGTYHCQAARKVTANQRIVSDRYAHHLSDGYSRPDRAERIWARLDALEAATGDDMAAIHRDVLSLRAPLWVERLRALLPSDPIERAALDALADWDCRMTVDSAAIFALAERADSEARALEELRGSMATAWMDERRADVLFIARGVGRPLWVGHGESEVLFASTQATCA